MNNLYEIAKSSGRFLYGLAKADLAYLGVSIALPVTMTLDLVETLRLDDKSKLMKRSLALCESALKFAETKNQNN